MALIIVWFSLGLLPYGITKHYVKSHVMMLGYRGSYFADEAICWMFLVMGPVGLVVTLLSVSGWRDDNPDYRFGLCYRMPSWLKAKNFGTGYPLRITTDRSP
ncbi:MAG: hypothetical protein KGI60_04150 [Patescibacteria group bacterium]|nr:hypothetical protein [Patescibacteria group bacterium]